MSGVGVSEIDFRVCDCNAAGAGDHAANHALCGGLGPKRGNRKR